MEGDPLGLRFASLLEYDLGEAQYNCSLLDYPQNALNPSFTNPIDLKF